MGLVPWELVCTRGGHRQEDDGLAFVNGQVLEQLPTLIPGPKRRVSGAAPATTDSSTAIRVPAAVSAPASWLTAPVTRWAPQHRRPRGSAPRRGGLSALETERRLAPVRFRSAPLVVERLR